jgi:hypothetical protein
MSELRSLRSENQALRSAPDAAKGDTVTELAETLITGFLLIPALCFVFFFCVLLLLSGKSPGEFFRYPAIHPLPVCTEIPAPEKTESIPDRSGETAYNHIPDCPAEYSN